MLPKNFTKVLIGLIILILLLGISMPIIHNYISNQRLRSFARQVYRDLLVSQKNALDSKTRPNFKGERTLEEIPTVKVIIAYQLQNGNEKPSGIRKSQEEFLINFQGLTAFSKIQSGTHIDFFIEDSPKSVVSVLFCPDGTPYQKGVIFLSNGRKTYSLIISPTGNIKLLEDAPLT